MMSVSLSVNQRLISCLHRFYLHRTWLLRFHSVVNLDYALHYMPRIIFTGCSCKYKVFQCLQRLRAANIHTCRQSSHTTSCGAVSTVYCYLDRHGPPVPIYHPSCAFTWSPQRVASTTWLTDRVLFLAQVLTHLDRDLQ